MPELRAIASILDESKSPKRFIIWVSGRNWELHLESGRIHRVFVRYATAVGFVFTLTAVILLAAHYMFPYLNLLNSLHMIVTFSGLILIGSAGVIIAVTQGVGIYRKKRETLRSIREKTADKMGLIDFGADSLPPYMLADSIDHEVLVTAKDLGGEVLDMEERLMKRGLVRRGLEFQRRISKLILLGLLFHYDDDKRLYLTSAGLDAVNTPPSLFISSIPETVWNLVLKQKRSLLQEDWGGIVVATSQALEAAMRNLIEKSIKSKPDEWEEISQIAHGRPLEKWPAGNLLHGLRRLGVVKQHSLEDYLTGELIKIRNRIHHNEGEGAFSASDADKCDIYLGLLLRSWFGVR